MATRNDDAQQLLSEVKRFARLGVGAARELASHGKARVEEFFDPECRLEKAVLGQFADMMKDGRLKPEEAQTVIVSRVGKVLDDAITAMKNEEKGGG